MLEGTVKSALISDVHSNLPALEAVLADIDERDEVGAVYHLGDLVGYAPWPNKPKEGDWRACYVPIEVGEGLGPVEHVRVEYDLERAVDGSRRGKLPDAFVDQLRAGWTSKPVEVS